jgi:hypothetical protein
VKTGLAIIARLSFTPYAQNDDHLALFDDATCQVKMACGKKPGDHGW